MDYFMKHTALSYLDLNPEMPNALVFIHGNSQSHKSYKYQMDSDYLNNFRLIFIDLPGHGDSPSIAEYSLKTMAAEVVLLIENLKLQNYIIVGHSLGGHVAINMTPLLCDPKALFLFGSPPLKNPFDSNAFLSNAKISALNQSESTNLEITNLLTELDYKNEDISIGVRDFNNTDPLFRTTILNDIFKGIQNNEVELINQFNGNVFFLISEQDKIINNKYIKDVLIFDKAFGRDFFEIDAGHSPHMSTPLEFNKLLFNFSENVFLRNFNHVNNVSSGEIRI
jgi:pimeloyl-ACP methyl ester carboxylesterase